MAAPPHRMAGSQAGASGALGPAGQPLGLQVNQGATGPSGGEGDMVVEVVGFRALPPPQVTDSHLCTIVAGPCTHIHSHAHTHTPMHTPIQVVS